MSDFDDAELRRTPEPIVRGPRQQPGVGMAIGGLLLAALAAVYLLLFWNRDAPAGTVPDRTAVATTTVEAQPLGGAAEAIDVPPLDATDPLVRQLLAALSSHPRVAAWLATDGLIRGFTVVVDTVASGRTPAAQLTVLKPGSPFSVAARGEVTLIDQASYARYDSLADGLASLDPAGVARVYATLKPRIEEAYRERFVGGPFDGRLERAIVVLLETPSMPKEMAVEPSGIGYAYADPAFEELPAAQKHLLRMGPRNADLVKSRLRAIALALGIPDDRLPGRAR